VAAFVYNTVYSELCSLHLHGPLETVL